DRRGGNAKAHPRSIHRRVLTQNARHSYQLQVGPLSRAREGQERAMLIKCAAYENGKKIADIPASEIHDYVCRPGCFVWVAMRDRDIALLEEMREQFNLHPLAVEDAQQGHQRPKIEEYGDSLFAVLHMVEPGTPDLRVGEVDIFAGPNYILSVRSGVERGFDDVRARCEA